MRLCLLCFAIRKIEMRIEVIKWPGNGFDIEKSPTFLIKIAVRHTHNKSLLGNRKYSDRIERVVRVFFLHVFRGLV